jgi:hypothetical protein
MLAIAPRQTMSRHDDARSLRRAVYSTEVDLIPDQAAKTLTVRLHPLANTSSEQALKHIFAPGPTPPRYNSRVPNCV